MASPEEIPEEIQVLFEKCRDKKISAKGRAKLERWIVGMQKVPGFDLKHICIDDFDYTSTDYNRLRKRVQRLKKKLTTSAKEVLREAEADDFVKWVEGAWEQVKTIGKDMVMGWTERASELGYYDEDSGEVRIKEFLVDACTFFVEKRQMIETVEERVKDVEAACQMFAELSKPQVVRIIALREYMDFVQIVTFLAARGIPVPTSVIDEVRSTVDAVMRGAIMRREEHD